MAAVTDVGDIVPWTVVRLAAPDRSRRCKRDAACRLLDTDAIRSGSVAINVAISAPSAAHAVR